MPPRPQPPRVESRLEFAFAADGYFDPAYFDPAYFDMADEWTDILGQGDVRAQVPIQCEYGIRGNTPTDRVANAGTLRFALNNSEFNSIRQRGYYSLLRADRRHGFDLNVGVRWRLSCPQVNGGQAYYKFLGTLDQAIPDPGIYGTRLTICTAVDIWDDYARIKEPDVPLQVAKRFDQIITTLLDALTTQPNARAIETGSEPYTYSLDGGTGQQLAVRERMIQLAMSEFGYIYTRGDTTGGGTFVAENRHHRVISTVARFTLDNSMDRDGLTVPGSRRDVFKAVQVLVHPTNNVNTSAPIVLWSIQQQQTVIQPGETNDVIFGAYFDPISHEQIGGYSPSPTYDPVAGTDYVMHDGPNGTGSVVTSSFIVVASRTGLGVRWTITNTGIVAGYLTTLQVRGIPIFRYDMQIDVSVPGAGGYGDQVLALDMPFQNSANTAQDVATALAQRYATPFANAPAVRFLANRSVAHMTAALELEPGDRIAVLEELTGLAAAFTINGVNLEMQAGGLLWCQWYIEPATAQQYWLIGVVGASELGVTTVLGY